SMGASAWMALYPMTGADVRRAAVPRTVSTAVRLGRAVREARSSHLDPFEELGAALSETAYGHGRVVFSGKVADVERRTEGGFTQGRAVLSGNGAGGSSEAGGSCELLFQNENLLARIDGRTVAVVPDLVTVLHAETGQPITTEALAFGQRVRVFVMPAP